MARDNPTWGQARVADELSLKLGIQVSPKTVRAYWPREIPPTRPRLASQSWQSFIRNHAQAIVACDFMVASSARFRVLYILLLMEISSRRILHCSVTEHPPASWTVQQFHEAIHSDHSYRLLNSRSTCHLFDGVGHGGRALRDYAHQNPGPGTASQCFL